MDAAQPAVCCSLAPACASVAVVRHRMSALSAPVATANATLFVDYLQRLEGEQDAAAAASAAASASTHTQQQHAIQLMAQLICGGAAGKADAEACWSVLTAVWEALRTRIAALEELLRAPAAAAAETGSKAKAGRQARGKASRGQGGQLPAAQAAQQELSLIHI